MCSIGLKSGLQGRLFLRQNTVVMSKSIFKLWHNKEFGLIQNEARNVMDTRLY